MTVATDAMSVALGAGALAVAVLGYRQSRQAHAASEAANSLSKDANAHSQHANELAESALAWQRECDEQRNSTQVRIEITQSTESVGLLEEEPGSDSLPVPLRHLIRIDVINDGEVAEAITGLGLQQMRSESEDSGYDIWPDGSKDRKVLPRRRFHTRVRVDELPFDLSRTFFAYVWLASGEEVESEAIELDAELAEHVISHNQSARPSS